MKRRISLLLAVVMILGSFSFAFAANSEVEPGEFLEDKGILKGDTTGNLNLDKPLERRDSVILLSRLFDEEAEAKAFEAEGLPTWEDNNDPNYNGYLAWGQSNNYFEGHSAVKFGPRENITVREYAVVLLRALGYNEEAGAWKEVFATAEKLGVLEGIEKEADEDVLRGEMAQMTFNALGLTMKGSKETLADKLGIEMPEAPKAKDLTAKVNNTKNLKEVVLELSNAELVDADKLENVNNYKVVGNVVEKAELDGDNVIVLLQEPLLEGREYKLRVRSIDKAINKEYKFVAKDNTIPSVESVEVLGEYGIKLRTSEPISLKDGDRGRNFVVDGKNIAMNVEVYGRDVILTPYYSESFSDDVETLTISGLADFAGFKSAREEFDIEMVEDEVAPEVVDVIIRGDKKVEVVFDKDIYIESVEEYYDRNNVGNISYESGRHTVYSIDAEKIDTNRVVYEFEEEFLRTRTDFTIVDVENHSGVKMEKTTMVAREIVDDIEPEIFDHEIVAKDMDEKSATIRLYFDKDVSGITDKDDSKLFDVKEHFTLYDREVSKRNESDAEVIEAKYATIKGEVREDVIDVKLIGLTEWTKTNEHDYVLEIENFTDQASRRNRMYRDYVEFKFQASTGFNIVTDGITVDERRYETEITIEFNKPVDRVIAEDPTNYIFTTNNDARRDVKDLKGTIVTEKRGYEVSIILPDFEVKDYDNLRILDTLKNTSGQRLDKVYVYDFETGFAENDNYTITKKEAGVYEVTSDKDEITLKTNVEGTFTIKSDLDKLTIDAPNADVVIDENVTVGEVVVKAIKAETLTINGTVDKVVVETEKVVNIKAKDKVFVVESIVEKATLKINDTEVTVKEGENRKVTIEGKTVEDKLVEDLELEEVKKQLQEEIEKAETLLKDENVKAAKSVEAALIVAKDNAEALEEDAKLEEVKLALTNLKKAIEDAEDVKTEAEAEAEAALAVKALEEAANAEEDKVEAAWEAEASLIDAAKTAVAKVKNADVKAALEERVADAKKAVESYLAAIEDVVEAVNGAKDADAMLTALEEALETLGLELTNEITEEQKAAVAAYVLEEKPENDGYTSETLYNLLKNLKVSELGDEN